MRAANQDLFEAVSRWLDKLPGGRRVWAVVAVASLVGLGTLGRMALDPLLGDKAQYTLFLLVVAIVGLTAGFWAAAVATALGGVAGFFLFVDEMSRVDFSSHMQLALYAVTGVLVGAVASWARRQRDLAARQAAALRANEEQLRLVAENIPQLAWMIEPDGQMAWFNKRWHDYTGTTLEQMREQGWGAVHHPEHFPRVWATWSRALATGEPWEDTFPLRGRDGQFRWFLSRAFPIRDESGQVRHWFGTNTDITEQRAAEEALRTSEERLRFAWLATRDVIWDWDVEKDQQRWSSAGADLFGWREAIEAPQTAAWWATRVNPQDRERVAASFHAALADPACHQWQDEYRFLRRDGSVANVLDRGYVIRDAAGKPLRMIGAMQDITTRKQMEEKLLESEERYRSMIETAQEGVWELDAQGCTSYVNAPMAAMLGYGVPEMEGRSLFDFMDTAAECEAEKLVQRRRQGIAEHHDFRFRHKDGRDVWTIVSTTPSFDAHGQFAGALAFVTDITARKQAEADLARTTGLLETLLASAPLGFCYLDRDLRYVRINERMAAMNGIPVVEHLGKTRAEIVPSLTPAAQEITTRILASGEPLIGHELSGETPAQPGVIRHWNESWYPVRDPGGAIVGFGVIAEDITERLQAEEQLRAFTATLEARVAERTAELTASNRELEGFTYTVAHDLRSPLRHVVGFMQLLQRNAGDKLDITARELLDRVITSAKRMQQLIDDLLEFSRLGRTELQRQPVDLQQLVAQIWQELTPDTEGRRIEWRVGPLPTVHADPRLLHQVFYNLLHNALKFTRPRPVAVIEVGSQPNTNGEHILFVRDNGVGFEMKYAHKLFGVFQRLHDQKMFEGTGIGLAHVHRIIQRHGGRVWVESQPDHGTTFSLTLSRLP